MVTMNSSHLYTGYALKSFFQNTELKNDDEFFLINNDGCEINHSLLKKNIKVIKNEIPLSFAENVNLIINKSIKKKKNLIFLNNDIIFTKNWILPLQENSKNISLPVNNQLFPYHSDCGNLKLKVTMNLNDFNEQYLLLDNIVEKHKKKFNKKQKAQTILMPFFCFKIPYEILNEIGYFDTAFVCGAEDVDYRIRCAKKGFEVDFLLDSYLLHFHGKSTWDGGETDTQTQKRNKLYTDEFLKKWGEDMTQIFILRKNFNEILYKKGLNDIFKEGKFGELIRKLTK